MKLGFVTAILPELSLNQVLEFAARRTVRVHRGDVLARRQGRTPVRRMSRTLTWSGFTQTRANDVNALCAKHGVSISALGYYPNPLDPDPAVAQVAVQHFRKVILAAEKLGLKNANTFVGRDWTKTVDENWPRFLKTWKPIIAFAEDHGIKGRHRELPYVLLA